MSHPIWAQAFLGGVADAELQHALWRNRSGRLVALRLADGHLLWRSTEPLRPLLLGHGLALGLAVAAAPAPPRLVALALDEAGAERWRSDALPLPLPKAETAGASDLNVHAGWLDGRILLRWFVQPLYRGGAAPGPARLKSAPATGSCLLDAASGSLNAAPAGLDSAKPAPALQEPSDDPHVLAQQVLGGVRYCLKQSPLAGAQNGTLRTALIAHDLARDRELWQCTLDEAPRQAPRALRP